MQGISGTAEALGLKPPEGCLFPGKGSGASAVVWDIQWFLKPQSWKQLIPGSGSTAPVAVAPDNNTLPLRNPSRATGLDFDIDALCCFH